jgi:hypothetical protein
MFLQFLWFLKGQVIEKIKNMLFTNIVAFFFYLTGIILLCMHFFYIMIDLNYEFYLFFDRLICFSIL